MFGISMWEILVVMALLVVLVGPDHLPGLARTLGKTLGKVRRSVDDIKEQTGLDEELRLFDEMRDLGRGVTEELAESMSPGENEELVKRPPPRTEKRKKGRKKISGPRRQAPGGNRSQSEHGGRTKAAPPQGRNRTKSEGNEEQGRG